MNKLDTKVELMIHAYLAHVGPAPFDMRRAMRAVLEALQADEKDEICLSANQVQELVALAKDGGPVWDCDITLREYGEFQDEETGETYPAGLYVFLTEYPEEGFIDRLNLYDAEETAAIEAVIAAGSASRAREGES